MIVELYVNFMATWGKTIHFTLEEKYLYQSHEYSSKCASVNADDS